MSERIATIVGATGMIGDYLLSLALNDTFFDRVRILVRRPYPTPNPLLEVKLVDFDDAESVKLALEGSTAVFSCIGTTQKSVKGDKALYRRIDFDIPARVARFAKEAGCEKFILISSVGANAKSSTFYLQLKGELEEHIAAIGFRSLHIFQPSVLLGDRKGNRPGERILQSSMKILGGLMIGGLQKYKAIEGLTVASAMLQSAKQTDSGVYRHEYNSILALAAANK